MMFLLLSAFELPDPKSFSSIGWLTVCFAALAAGINQVWALIARIKGKPARGGNVGREEMQEELTDLKRDLENQIKDVRSCARTEVHRLGGEVQGLRSTTEVRAEGVPNRINALMELVNYMRGQFDSVLAEQRASTAATQRAASATENAVRLLSDKQHVHVTT